MKTVSKVAAAGLLAVGVTAGAPAFADCTIVQDSIESAAMDPGSRSVYQDQIVRDLRQLRNAAQTLASYGREDACESVAEVISDLANDPQAALESRQAEGVALELTDPSITWAEVEEARMAESEPLTDRFGTLRATELTGIDVRDSSGESVGEIEDVLFGSEGQPGYAIVTYGGFLGLGEEQVALPMDQLKIAPDQSVVYASLTKAQIEDAPTFERGQFDWVQDSTWRDSNDSYFDAL